MTFVQEVFWCSYFKGWMQLHPGVWYSYQSGLEDAFEALQRYKFHMTDNDEAIDGFTGIDCFDHWHADFFLRHLIDGDPAANTLSLQWLGGLHTKGTPIWPALLTLRSSLMGELSQLNNWRQKRYQTAKIQNAKRCPTI